MDCVGWAMTELSLYEDFSFNYHCPPYGFVDIDLPEIENKKLVIVIRKYRTTHYP